MISKREIMERICVIEVKCDELTLSFNKLDKRLKKLEPKKAKKSAAKIEDIPEIETADLISKAVPPPKCVIRKGFNSQRRIK